MNHERTPHYINWDERNNDTYGLAQLHLLTARRFLTTDLESRTEDFKMTVERRFKN